MKEKREGAKESTERGRGKYRHNKMVRDLDLEIVIVTKKITVIDLGICVKIEARKATGFFRVVLPIILPSLGPWICRARWTSETLTWKFSMRLRSIA